MKMNQKEILLKVWKYIKGYRGRLGLSIALASLSVILTLYAPVLVGAAIDYIVEQGKVEFTAIYQLLLRLAAVALITGLCQWIMNLLNNHIAYGIVADIRRDVFARLQRLPLRYMDSHPYGDVVSRVIADADQFADGLLLGFGQLFTGVLTILGTLLFMLSLNPAITLVVVCLTPLSLIVANFIAKSTFSLFNVQSQTRGRQTAFVDEMIGNQKVVQAFLKEEETLTSFEEINEQLERCSLKAIFFSSLTNPCTRFINSLVYAAVALSGAFAAIRGNISIGDLSCFLSYAKQYTKPFNEISGVVTELQNAIACAGRIFELMEEKEQLPDKQEARLLQQAEGFVNFEKVSFSYLPGQRLIENLNLKVRPGEKIAIVGPTGCGKTTLINLLMRFYDVTGGCIRVDGVDIRDYTRKSLRLNFGMVLQDTWLKEGTVWENIAMGNKEASREAVIEAAKAAHAHSFIKRLPNGYDTWLTEDGGSLSQGQKQLICIARIMLLLPPMLILDEATSSIDTRTEMKIQEAFGRLMEGRVSFIVAHRLSTIRDADQILVMKEGSIIEQGNHEQLLNKKGFYYQLYYSQ
ncbi:MAG: ABC transporter ATP-binding protein/permease [Lachnospiraceae bacterium]|nr:ABC transporter ATP-binding protein/permease [Lachnospiraceae bacterium]MCI7595492.1 ABC transporter ATP-binding protein/permease [Lachnospiraceae bacterium]MDY3223355.1 ABC transporter ATP-binding protein [Lachnospiraceae bacterium]